MNLNFNPKEDYYYATALAALAFFAAPAVVYVNNFIDLHHVDPIPSLAVLAISTLAVAAILSAILYILSRLGLSIIGFLLRPLFFFLLFMTLVQPLIGNTAELNIASLRIPVWWLSLILFLIAAIIWSLSNASGTLLFVSFAFIALNGALHAYQLLTWGGAKNTPAIETLSSDRNLIVVSIDGVTRDIAREVLEKNPELKAKLKDFVFFTNAVSSAPNTRASIIAEIAGTRNLKQRYGNEQNMVRSIPRKNLLTNVLAANGYGVATYGEYSNTLSDQANGFPVGRLLQQKSTAFHIVNAVDLFHFALPAMLAPNQLAKWLQNIWLTLAGQRSAPKSRLDRLNAHKGERWERALLLSGVEFDTYIKRLHTNGSAPRAHFLHFVHTHWPISIDAGCAYKADNLQWYLNHQNGKAHRDVLVCSLSQFAAVLKKLKDLKIYDNATIVLKGDHGEIAHYMDRTKLESFTFHGHKQLGYARYTPMLAIKRRSQSAEQLSFNNQPVALSDLAKTLCKSELGDNKACKQIRGFDILDPKPTISEQESYNVYVPTNASSDWKLDDHIAISVPRRADFFAALNGKMTDQLLRSTPQCAAAINFTKGQAYNNGKSDGKSWVTWRHDRAWFVKTKPPSCTATIVRLRFTGAIDTPDVRINGKPASAIPASDGKKPQAWSLNLPAGIKPGEHIEISVVSPAGQPLARPVSLEYLAKPAQ